MRNSLLSAAIINFVVAGFMFLQMNTFSLISVAFLVITGVVYLNYAKLPIKDLATKVPTLEILGLVSLVFNFITSIIILIDADRIKSDYMRDVNNNDLKDLMPHEISAPFKPIVLIKPAVNKEAQRIDILLKLGVLMVGISGLIFATTSWDVIPEVAKIFALLMMGFLFCALSRFNEVKLKIPNTTVTYWLLGMGFFVFAYVAMGYFEIFGTWFSLTGEGSNLYVAFMAMEVTLLAAMSYKKFNNLVYLYSIFVGILASIYFTLAFLELGIGLIFLIIILLNGLCNFIKSDDIELHHLNRFALVMSYVIGFMLINSFGDFENTFVIFAAAILSIANVLYVGLRDDDKTFGILSAILIVVTAFASVSGLDYTIGQNVIIWSSFYALSYIFLFMTKLIFKNAMFNVTYTILINFALLLCFYVSYFDNEYVVLFTGGMTLLTSILYYFSNREDKVSLERFIQPFKVLLFVTAALYFLSINVFNFTDTMNMCLSFIAMMIMYVVVGDSKLKYEYFMLFCGLLILSLLSVLSSREAIPAAIVLLSSLMPFVIADSTDDVIYNKYKIPSFVFLLLTSYFTIVTINLLGISIVNAGILLLLLYGIIMTLTKKDRNLYLISSTALFVPITTIVYNIDCSSDIRTILYATEMFYGLYLFAYNTTMHDNDKDAMVSILASLILIATVFNSGIVIGLYVGIVSLIVLYIGFAKDIYKSLFYVGIVSLTVNIIYQLWDLWEKIPFWLYLLLAGLSIIGFVTYKEMKKLK